MPTLLLTVLFAIAPFQDGYLPPPPPPEIQHFIDVNLEWDTHAEGWDKVMLIPQARPAVTLPVSEDAEDNVYRGMGTDTEQWRWLVDSQFADLGSDTVEMVLRIMGCESGGNPSARNKTSGAAGLMQVMPFWAESWGWEYDDLFIPELNMWAAREIYDQQGWNAWTCWRR